MVCYAETLVIRFFFFLELIVCSAEEDFNKT